MITKSQRLQINVTLRVDSKDRSHAADSEFLGLSLLAVDAILLGTEGDYRKAERAKCNNG
jgi:hypothetical protein